MAIGPIPDLRPLDVMQPRGLDPELRPIHLVESSARSGDSLSRRKPLPRRDADTVELAGSAPADASDETPIDASAEPPASSPAEPAAAAADPADGESGSNINLFA